VPERLAHLYGGHKSIVLLRLGLNQIGLFVLAVGHLRSTRNSFLFLFNIDSLLFFLLLLVAVLRFNSLRGSAGVRFFGIKIFIFVGL